MMPKLVTTSNLSRHDDIYAQLVALHDGLDEEQSLQALSRLALILINHIGDADVAREAIEAARRATGRSVSPPA